MVPPHVPEHIVLEHILNDEHSSLASENNELDEMTHKIEKFTKQQKVERNKSLLQVLRTLQREDSLCEASK
jgi:hypothetical protein